MADVFDLAVKEFGGGDVFAVAARELTGPGRGGRKVTQAQVNALPKQPEGTRWDSSRGEQVKRDSSFGIPTLATGMDQLLQTGAVEGSRKRGLHNVIVGGGQVAAAPALSAASPLALVAGLASGAAGSVAGKAGAEALGASPETADLVGDAGGAIAGVGGSLVGPRAVRALGAGAKKLAPGWGNKLVEAFSAMRDKWNGVPENVVPVSGYRQRGGGREDLVNALPQTAPLPEPGIIDVSAPAGRTSTPMTSERTPLYAGKPETGASAPLARDYVKFPETGYPISQAPPKSVIVKPGSEYRSGGGRSLETPATPAPVRAESPVAQSVDPNKVTVLADILKGVGIPVERVSEIPPEGWEMIAKSAGLSEHPDAATVQAAIAEMSKPKSPLEINVRRRQARR